MVAVPAETPVTTPEEEMATIAEFDDNHGLLPAGKPEPVSVAVWPTHTLVLPVIVGVPFMVIEAADVHPRLLV